MSRVSFLLSPFSFLLSPFYFLFSIFRRQVQSKNGHPPVDIGRTGVRSQNWSFLNW